MYKRQPQNTAETNAKQRFDDIDKTITDNISKYGDRIQSAYNAFDKIKADKSGIAGIGDVFKSSEEQINKWATAVAKGKMGISEFEKKVSGLSGSVGSIGKIIDPASITDAKGELESYLRELTNVQAVSYTHLDVYKRQMEKREISILTSIYLIHKIKLDIIFVLKLNSQTFQSRCV